MVVFARAILLAVLLAATQRAAGSDQVGFSVLGEDGGFLLLMDEILHQFIGSCSHYYLTDFIHPRWCRISSINSSIVMMPTICLRTCLKMHIHDIFVTWESKGPTPSMPHFIG